MLTLLREGIDRVDLLAERLNVSAATVRRDLNTLNQSGQIARTYGGAITRDTFHERPVSESAKVARRAKAAIAERAAEFVRDGSSIFLDAGTTCAALASLLAVRRELTVVTRGLEVAVELASAPDVNVTVVGGHLRHLSHGMIGPIAESTLRRYSFDVGFLGADFVSPLLGLGEPMVEETMLKELAAERSREVVILADSSKFAGDTPPAWLAIAKGWRLVTDDGIEPHVVSAFADAGVDVVVA